MGNAVGKRMLDVIVGSVLLILVLPMIVVCAVGTSISLRSWPFFTQTRIGRDGKMFRFVKLRTLPPHAPRYASKYELVEVRIPRFSLALRNLHLDELPQLFLVVIGKMSLVGPRPEMPHLHDQFGDEFGEQRTAVRPGCTGLWQVSEYCTQMIYEHPEFDAHYLLNRSLRLDVWIIAQTVRVHLPGGDKHLVSMSTLPSWATRTAAPVTSDERSLSALSLAAPPVAAPSLPAPSLSTPFKAAPDVHFERAMQVVEN